MKSSANIFSKSYRELSAIERAAEIIQLAFSSIVRFGGFSFEWFRKKLPKTMFLFASADSPTTIVVSDQGCQMVCFQTKNPNLGKFWMD
jgi:hypothetical protein